MPKHAMRARREAAQRPADASPAAPAPAAGARAFGGSFNASDESSDAEAAPGAPALAAALERTVAALDLLADDPAYPPESQQAFVRQARELRRRAALLDAAQFDAGTARFEEAMTTLGDVNRALRAAQGQIAEVPAMLALVTRAAGVLDALLGAVT